MDQDSNPIAGMKNALLIAHAVHPNRDNLAILAPDIIETALSARTRYIRPIYHFLFERVICQDEILRNVSFVITSGAMYNLNLYKCIGPFRDDFFIDAVDKEYCLRAISKGYEIAIACNAHLEHHLGNRQQKSFLGNIYNPTFHLPFRWYYMSRNRIAMLRLYGWRFPHWFFYELGITLKSLAQMLLFENHRKLKMKALIHGTWDGMVGKMGEMPPKIKAIVTKCN